MFQCDRCTYEAKTMKALNMHYRVHGEVRRIPCDGSLSDYKRHLYNGETACPASKRAWRQHYNKKRSRIRRERIDQLKAERAAAAAAPGDPDCLVLAPDVGARPLPPGSGGSAAGSGEAEAVL